MKKKTGSHRIWNQKVWLSWDNFFQEEIQLIEKGLSFNFKSKKDIENLIMSLMTNTKLSTQPKRSSLQGHLNDLNTKYKDRLTIL